MKHLDISTFRQHKVWSLPLLCCIHFDRQPSNRLVVWQIIYAAHCLLRGLAGLKAQALSAGVTPENVEMAQEAIIQAVHCCNHACFVL